MSTGKVRKESHRPTKAPSDSELPDQTSISVKSWAVPIDEVFSNADIRLDAAHFNPATANTVQELRDSGLEPQPLSNLASVELRNRFTRIWACDREHGLPYLNATDLLSLLALGVPAGGLRYLSYATDTDIESLVIHEGWILMSCSGTVSRVFYVPEHLDGWVATHDLIRIVPNKPDMTGYLYAWLSTPIAQSQILSHTHGGQIDHVTDAQVGGVLVPLLSPSKIKNINAKVMKALRSRERAIEALNSAWQIE